MIQIIFWVARGIVRAIEVHLWIIYHDSWISFIMQHVVRSFGMYWRFNQGMLTWFVCWTGIWSALILRVCGWAPVRRWSVMFGVMVGMIIAGVRGSWSTPVVMSIVFMMGPGTSFVWITVTVTVISVGTGLRSWSAVSLSVLVTVMRSLSGVVPGMGFLPVMMARHTKGWCLMQTVHHYMTIFITFEAMYIWTMTCYVTQLWHWNQWSSSWDIAFTADEGSKVAVSCCAAWSFSTLLMVSARVYSPFS